MGSRVVVARIEVERGVMGRWGVSRQGAVWVNVFGDIVNVIV